MKPVGWNDNNLEGLEPIPYSNLCCTGWVI